MSLLLGWNEIILVNHFKKCLKYRKYPVHIYYNYHFHNPHLSIWGPFQSIYWKTLWGDGIDLLATHSKKIFFSSHPFDISAIFNIIVPSFSLLSFRCTYLTGLRILSPPLRGHLWICPHSFPSLSVSHISVLMGPASYSFGNQTNRSKSELRVQSVKFWTLLSIIFLFCKLDRITQTSQDFFEV